MKYTYSLYERGIFLINTRKRNVSGSELGIRSPHKNRHRSTQIAYAQRHPVQKGIRSVESFDFQLTQTGTSFGLAFLAAESASVTDGDHHWRFNRVGPSEWGSGRREISRASSDNEYEEEEKAYLRARASWSAAALVRGKVRGVGDSGSRDRGGRGHRSLEPGARAGERRRSGDARPRWGRQQRPVSAAFGSRATSEGNLAARGRRYQHRRPSQHRRRKSQATAASRDTTRGAGRIGGWGGEGGTGGGGIEEEFSGWFSAPEGSSGGVDGPRRKPHSVRAGVGGHVGTGSEWRSRGASGRRPASREAARQLRVSERLHRLAQTMAKKKERERRRRDDLQQARVRKAPQKSPSFPGKYASSLVLVSFLRSLPRERWTILSCIRFSEASVLSCSELGVLDDLTSESTKTSQFLLMFVLQAVRLPNLRTTSFRSGSCLHLKALRVSVAFGRCGLFWV